MPTCRLTAHLYPRDPPTSSGASRSQKRRGESMGMPSISPGSTNALSPVTRASACPPPPASIGISSGFPKILPRRIAGPTTSPSASSNSKKPLTTCAGRWNFRERRRRNSFSTGSQVSRCCSLTTASMISAQRPRVARPLASTLVSSSTFTRRRGRHPHRSGSRRRPHRAWPFAAGAERGPESRAAGRRARDRSGSRFGDGVRLSSNRTAGM